MSFPSFRFNFLNAPGLPFTKWYVNFEKNAEEKNTKFFIFGDKALANTFFVKTIIQKRIFLNVYYDSDIPDKLNVIENYIKNYCESLLIKGAFSECPLKFDYGDDIVLRDYRSINLQERMDSNWFFYYNNKPEYFSKLSDNLGNMPLSYIWSMFFTENDTEALILDDYVLTNRHMFKNIIIETDIKNNKKYKIIFVDANLFGNNIKHIISLVMQNGIVVIRNMDFEIPNMVGWRDLRNRMIGLIRV